jgi:hypothetical protein
MSGVFYTAAELARRGLIVAPTSRSARGPDVLVMSPETKKNYTVQVKTTRTRQHSWRLGRYVDEEVSDTLYYVFAVIEGGDDTPDFFIVPSKTVSDKKWHDPTKDYPPTFGREEAEPFRDMWDQIK